MATSSLAVRRGDRAAARRLPSLAPASRGQRGARPVICEIAAEHPVEVSRGQRLAAPPQQLLRARHRTARLPAIAGHARRSPSSRRTCRLRPLWVRPATSTCSSLLLAHCCKMLLIARNVAAQKRKRAAQAIGEHDLSCTQRRSEEADGASAGAELQDTRAGDCQGSGRTCDGHKCDELSGGVVRVAAACSFWRRNPAICTGPSPTAKRESRCRPRRRRPAPA